MLESQEIERVWKDEESCTKAAKDMKKKAHKADSGFKNNVDKAMECYELAADLFATDGTPSVSNDCLLEVAHRCVKRKEYDRAIDLFEKVARTCIDNGFPQRVSDYFLFACLCQLCKKNATAVHDAIDAYKVMDPSIAAQCEFHLLEEILVAYENHDIDAFAKIDDKLDNRPFCDEKQSMLCRVKDSLTGKTLGVQL